MGLNTIYLICAIGGGTVLLLRLVMMIIGLDHGETPDSGVDLDHDGSVDAPDGNVGMKLLSLQSIAGFFTMFGLVGLGLLQVKAGPIWSLLGALAAGLVTAWVTAMIFYQMRRLQSEGTMVIQDAIGQIGSVYLTIPEQGTGVVSVAVKGTLRSLDAMSETGQRIPTGAMVRVTGVTAGKILVVVEQTAEHS
ncbi:MAG TPA: hypothetical protein PLA25_00640 [Anaerolineaceae bacterium]|nr:hypothetical protein [Anaerolineaceae bacterium]